MPETSWHGVAGRRWLGGRSPGHRTDRSALPPRGTPPARRAWRGGRLATAWAALAFALAAPAGAEPVRSLLELRRERVVVQEWDLSCGAAALATILNYQMADPVSEREIALGLMRRAEYLADPGLVRQRWGFSLLDLKRYVVERGYSGLGYGQLTFDDLVALAPAIVPVAFTGYNHFVVFRGRWRDRVVLADPAWGNRTLTVEEFEDAWLRYPDLGRVGFVVAHRDGTVPPNRLAPRPDDFVLLR